MNAVHTSALVYPFFPLTYLQYVDYVRAEGVLLVIGGASLAFAVVIAELIGIAERLRVIVTGVQHQTCAIALLDGDVAAVPGVVIEVRRQVDGSELRVGTIIEPRVGDRTE